MHGEQMSNHSCEFSRGETRRINPIFRSALRGFDSRAEGYDVLLLSDLLHFDSSHLDLISTVSRTLSRSAHARVYVGAGLYTREPIREGFLQAGRDIGLEWSPMNNDGVWRGEKEIHSDGVPWSLGDLNARKSNVVAWVGKWKGFEEQ